MGLKMRIFSIHCRYSQCPWFDSSEVMYTIVKMLNGKIGKFELAHEVWGKCTCAMRAS